MADDAAPSPAVISPGRDEDEAGFIALIGRCWDEYPGMVLDVEAEVPELRALASFARGRGGALWKAEAEGRIVGMIAAWPEHVSTWMIARMYVDRAHRGTGLADCLLGLAEAHATAAGATSLELWTDTRFTRSHSFYERQGYRKSGAVRHQNDLSQSVEFQYKKTVPIST